MQKRLNYIKVILRNDATTGRIMRLLEFIKPIQNRVRILLEIYNLDDCERHIVSMIKLFKGFPMFSVFIKKCNI